MLKSLSRGDVQVLIARYHDRLTGNSDDFGRLMKTCERSKIKISLYTRGELDLSTASGGFYGFIDTGRSWYESAIRSQELRTPTKGTPEPEREPAAGQDRSATRSSVRTSARALPVGGASWARSWSQPKKSGSRTATRVLSGESLRSIAMDWNERGVKTVVSGTWRGSIIRRVLMSPRIAGLKEHRGEIVGEAKWPAIIDRATHDRLVGLLGDESRRPAN
jgi:site-specific DNA recombinase